MFVVMQEYLIDSRHREEYLELMKVIIQSATELGCVFYELYENDDKPCHFVEMMGFDSWSHYERLRRKEPRSEVTKAWGVILGFVEGGEEGVQVTHLTQVST